MSKGTYFFGDKGDLHPMLSAFEDGVSLGYYESGMHQRLNIPPFKSLLELPDLGTVPFGDWNHNRSFLVIAGGTTPALRKIDLRDGSTRFAVDQLANPASIVLKLSGVFENQIMVGGSATTISNDAFAKEAMTRFDKAIKKHFRKVGTFYVGPGAMQKLKAGWRLVTNDKSPAEYDLRA